MDITEIRFKEFRYER